PWRRGVAVRAAPAHVRPGGTVAFRAFHRTVGSAPPEADPHVVGRLGEGLGQEVWGRADEGPPRRRAGGAGPAGGDLPGRPRGGGSAGGGPRGGRPDRATRRAPGWPRPRGSAARRRREAAGAPDAAPGRPPPGGAWARPAAACPAGG